MERNKIIKSILREGLNLQYAKDITGNQVGVVLEDLGEQLFGTAEQDLATNDSLALLTCTDIIWRNKVLKVTLNWTNDQPTYLMVMISKFHDASGEYRKVTQSAYPFTKLSTLIEDTLDAITNKLDIVTGL